MSLPVLVLLLLAGLTAVDATSTRQRCEDAARDVALAVARGEPASSAHLPPGATFAVGHDGDRVRVEVTAPVFAGWRRFTVHADATAAVEQ